MIKHLLLNATGLLVTAYILSLVIGSDFVWCLIGAAISDAWITAEVTSYRFNKAQERERSVSVLKLFR